jgi:hypothetical protein
MRSLLIGIGTILFAASALAGDLGKADFFLRTDDNLQRKLEFDALCQGGLSKRLSRGNMQHCKITFTNNKLQVDGSMGINPEQLKGMSFYAGDLPSITQWIMFSLWYTSSQEKLTFAQIMFQSKDTAEEFMNTLMAFRNKELSTWPLTGQ